LYFGADFVTVWVIGRIGGAAASLTGMVNDRTKGAFDRLRNYRGKKAGENMTKTKQGNRFSNNNPFARAFNSASMGVGKPVLSFNPKTMRSNLAQARKTRVEMMTGAGTQRIKEMDEYKLIKDDDNALMAATYGSAGAAKKGLKAKGWDDARIAQAVNAVHTSIGFGNAQQAAAAQGLAATGTGWGTYTDAQGNQVTAMEEMIDTMARASNGNEQVGAALSRYTNSVNKSKGRHDMSPGTKNMMNAVQSEIRRQSAGTTRSRAEVEEELHKQGGLFDQSWNSADPFSLVSDKPRAITANLSHWKGEYVKAHQNYQKATTNEQRQQAIGRAQQAEAALYEMDQYRTYAPGDNNVAINKTFDDPELKQARQWLDTPIPGAQPMAVHRRGDVRKGENPDQFYQDLQPPTLQNQARSNSRVRGAMRPPA
jgi:hypothetical protein